MSGPWEKYSPPKEDKGDASGPWAKYQQPAQSDAADASFNSDDLPAMQAVNAVGRGINYGVNKLDSVTGAPVRSAIYAAQNADQPFQILPDAMNAAGKQFGRDNSSAPTGQDIVENAGMAKGSLGAKAAGFGMDMLSNPTSFVPIGEMVGAGARAAGKAVGIGTKAAEIASDALPAASRPGAIARGAGAAAETFTGVDKNLAANYAANTDRVNQIIGKYAGPEGYEEAAHATDVRGHWRSVIQDTRQKMNDLISHGLNTPEASEPTVSAIPVMDKLAEWSDRAHPVTQSADKKAIQGITDMAQSMIDANGDISPKDLHALKMKLYEIAKPEFDAAGNAIFPQGDLTAKAAKSAAGSASQELIDNGPKNVSAAESVLSKLHRAEDTMNSTMLKDNGPVHAIGRAGANQGGIEAESLNRLQRANGQASGVLSGASPEDAAKTVGYDFNQDAKDFATARSFAKTGLSPVDSTGKSVARQALSTGVGGGIGYMVGGLPGALVGREVAKGVLSPLGFKAGVNLANSVSKFPATAGEIATGTARRIINSASSPVGKIAIDLGTKGALTPSPVLVPSFAESQANRSPAKKLPGYADGGPVLNPDKVKAFTAAGGFPKPKPTPPPATSNYAFGGGPVPGHAKAQGNSSQNDTVHAMLSPGEIVLPRSVTQAKNAPEAAARFVAAHLKSHASGQTKGENKWAEQGLGKLGIQDRDLASKILQDPKSKRLLIQASDLAPNSKAMKQIMTQIQKGWAK